METKSFLLFRLQVRHAQETRLHGFLEEPLGAANVAGLHALCPPAVWVPHSLVLMSQLPGVVVVLSQF